MTCCDIPEDLEFGFGAGSCGDNFQSCGGVTQGGTQDQGWTCCQVDGTTVHHHTGIDGTLTRVLYYESSPPAYTKHDNAKPMPIKAGSTRRPGLDGQLRKEASRQQTKLRLVDDFFENPRPGVSECVNSAMQVVNFLAIKNKPGAHQLEHIDAPPNVAKGCRQFMFCEESNKVGCYLNVLGTVFYIAPGFCLEFPASTPHSGSGFQQADRIYMLLAAVELSSEQMHEAQEGIKFLEMTGNDGVYDSPHVTPPRAVHTYKDLKEKGWKRCTDPLGFVFYIPPSTLKKIPLRYQRRQAWWLRNPQNSVEGVDYFSQLSDACRFELDRHVG